MFELGQIHLLRRMNTLQSLFWVMNWDVKVQREKEEKMPFINKVPFISSLIIIFTSIKLQFTLIQHEIAIMCSLKTAKSKQINKQKAKPNQTKQYKNNRMLRQLTHRGHSCLSPRIKLLSACSTIHILGPTVQSE